MMRKLSCLLFVLFLATPALARECPPAGQTRESLQALKILKFTLPDADARNALAEGLLGCLADPDSNLRDGIAYEALAQWMRAGDFDADELRKLRDALYAMLDGDDADGFRRPFSALVLSEVARTDRIQPWMTPVEREDMVDKATAFVQSIDDYRGYDDGQGWRHGVAQAVPDSAHAYVFGEPGRLARPVLYIAQRGVYSDADWQAWFAALPPKLGDASKAYADSAWLARRHDLMMFFMSLYLEADQSEDARIRALKPAIVAALKQVP